MKWKTPSHLSLHPATRLQLHHPYPLAGDQHQAKGYIMDIIRDAIEEKLLKIIEKPEKEPDGR